ncbi:MAG: bile acid:sodium symporter family protein [Treponema sp.]|jgi:tagaturonate reductase|nr:bile acid:sodium symporter family protein [Treponema sp.]
MNPLQNAAGIAHRINRRLERLIPITTPFGIIIGFLLPAFFIQFRPAIPWLFGMMTFSGALKLRVAELGAAVRSPVPILLVFVTSHVIMPLSAMLLSSLIFPEIDVVTGFVLLFAGPTAVSGFVWVLIFRGDKALGLTLMLLDTILAPLVVPYTLSILLGETITMDMTGIALSLMMMVVIPTIVGVAVNEVSKGKIPSHVSPYFDPISKLCLIIVIAANASTIAPKIRFSDPLVWQAAVVCVLLTFAGFFLIKLVSVLGKCGKDKGISMVFAGGLRNNSAVMTIAVAFFPEAAVLPTLTSIVFQHSIAAIMGKALAGEKKDTT